MSWFDDAVGHYIDHHPRADDRVTPLGAPALELMLLRDALADGSFAGLVAIPSYSVEVLEDAGSVEAAAAGLFVNYYVKVWSGGFLQELTELLVGLRGLDVARLREIEPGFRRFAEAFGELGARLVSAREAYDTALARLRSAHSKFFDISTTSRHAETARHFAMREQGGRPPAESEFLREVPPRIERSFHRAIGKLTQGIRACDQLPPRLYDPTLWRSMGVAPSQALESVRVLRSDCEAAFGRAARFPRVRRAAGDLRSAATFSAGKTEDAVNYLRLPEALVERLSTTLER